MTYDASNRKDIRRAEKAEAARELARVNFICAAMSRVEGRAWFHQLLTSCHIYHSSFTGDAAWDDFHCGERNIGLSILADIHAHCVDEYMLMIKEASYGNGNTRTDDESDDESNDEPGGGPT